MELEWLGDWSQLPHTSELLVFLISLRQPRLLTVPADGQESADEERHRDEEERVRDKRVNGKKANEDGVVGREVAAGLSAFTATSKAKSAEAGQTIDARDFTRYESRMNAL